MQIIIFLIEIILIFFWLEYDSMTFLEEKSSNYTSYSSIDVVGDRVLTLENISENQKIEIWKSSLLKDEMLSHFPDLYRMSEFFRERVIDDSEFKENYVEYMEYIHGEYLSGEMNKDEFRDALSNPNFSIVPY